MLTSFKGLRRAINLDAVMNAFCHDGELVDTSAGKIALAFTQIILRIRSIVIPTPVIGSVGYATKSTLTTQNGARIEASIGVADECECYDLTLTNTTSSVVYSALFSLAVYEKKYIFSVSTPLSRVGSVPSMPMENITRAREGEVTPSEFGACLLATLDEFLV